MGNWAINVSISQPCQEGRGDIPSMNPVYKYPAIIYTTIINAVCVIQELWGRAEDRVYKLSSVSSHKTEKVRPRGSNREAKRRWEQKDQLYDAYQKLPTYE